MRKEDAPEICPDRAEYFESLRLANSIIGLASIIPREERAEYNIPRYLNSRSIRNALARKSLNAPMACDAEHLETTANIARWLLSKTNS